MAGKPITKEIFITRANKKYNNKYDYTNLIWNGFQKSTTFICPEHEEFTQTPNDHLRVKHGCPKCGYNAINNKTRVSREDFIKRSKKLHGNKYDYSLVKLSCLNEKIDIICPKHGKFSQLANNHIRGMGCQKCAGNKIAEKIKLSLPEYINRVTALHNNKYDYSLVKNITPIKDTKITIICPTHGEFIQRTGNHLNGYGCPKCSHNGTSKDEDILEQYFIKNNIKYIRNDDNIISPKELDFYLPDHNIGIELNGVYWHSELKGKDKFHHIDKTNLCKEAGIRLIHYTDYDLHTKYNKVIANLNSLLNINKRKLYARKCEIREIETPLKSKFLKKYHLQGNDKCNIKLGLFYNNKLVSVMTFCKRRIALGKKSSGEGEYELSRFCNNFNFYVIGGASKLLKYFERNYTPSRIITYADKSRSVGNLYVNLGFAHTHDSPPNYWYFKSHYLTDKLYHRFNFRKSELSKKLNNFDPNKTEWENMMLNGWNRIWDCGNMVFEKTY